MNFKEELKQKIIDWGAYSVSFFNDDFKHYKNGISFYVKLSKDILREIDNKPTYTYFHHYRSVNSLIDSISLRTGILLDKAGYNWYSIPASQTVNGHDSFSGEYSHKKGACLSGLGYMGKSGLFISNDCGSAVRLGTVFTDLDLECENKEVESQCNDCNLCMINCPAMAINQDGVDRKCCSDYMKNNFQKIGRGSVCGICIRVCPKNNL